MNKKGQVFDNLKAMTVGVLSLVVILAIVFVILAETTDQIVDIQGVNEANQSAGAWTHAYNATNTLTGAAEDIPVWIPLVILALLGSVLLGIVRTIW